jgi:hypothetical protein
MADIEATATEADTTLDLDAAVTETNPVAADQDNQPEGDDEGELVVSIGEEAPPSDEQSRAPEWVRDLRKRDRENVKRIKELEARLQEKEQPAAVALPAKPTLEGCDYDAEAFEAKLSTWYDAKRAHDETAAQQRKAQEQAEAAWQAKVASYQESKAKLPAHDVDEAEDLVKATFNETQWAILVDGLDNPALVIYALGKNPAKAKELAAVGSLSRFAVLAGRLETEVKTSKRATKPSPETSITGLAAGGVKGSDATLERLREEAMRTGNMTRLVEYKAKLRRAAS